jgi:DNA-directed RNA polymerase specialized sigma24 family protein
LLGVHLDRREVVNKRRRRFANELSTKSLEGVRKLIRFATAQVDAVSTQVLLRRAGLERDPKTGLGALKMAEVLGLIHSTRGERKALVWRAGRPLPRPQRDPKLWDPLPYRRLRDLLQYFRGSAIGTPDLVRDAALPNRREALGALKALLVLGHVESEHLDPQTIAWRWISGAGQPRTYLRGYFAREATLLSLDEGPRDEQGRVMWPWIDEVMYREWLLQEQLDGFGSVAATDGMKRYRPPTTVGNEVMALVGETLRSMGELARAATSLVLVYGLTEKEVAKHLSISRPAVRRLVASGCAELQRVLATAGYAPQPMEKAQSLAAAALANAA